MTQQFTNQARIQQNNVKKNSGFSIIMVIVAMAFVGVLVAVIMLASLYNFYSKATNRKSKDNFYTAETALEEIRSGLQIEVDNAFNVAYMSVFQDYSSNLSEKNTRFGKAYRTTLVNNLQSTSVDVDSEKQYDLSKIRGYVTKPYDEELGVGAAVTGVLVDYKTDEGNTETKERNALIEYADGVRLEGIQITYYDEQGYVSIISTNILLKVPELDLINPVIVPPLEDYTLIANKNLTISEQSGRGAIIKGGFYGGSEGMTIAPLKNLTIERATFQDTADQNSHHVYAITDKDIDVGTVGSAASLTIEPGIEVWANGINTFGNNGGKSLTMNKDARYQSSIYLQDDLTIRGNGNRVNLAGGFYGFGSVVNGAGNSSAIVINGTDTIMDLSGLDSLKLAGNAYIATRNVNDGVSESDLIVDSGEEKEEEKEEETLVEQRTMISHRKQSGGTNYFTFPAGRWKVESEDNLHAWSEKVDSSHPENTYYTVTFTGHKIDIYAGKNKMMGYVNYYIDGEETTPRATADLYNSSNVSSVRVATISGLTEGTHTLKAVATGGRNTAGSEDLKIDAAEVYVYTYVKPEEQEIATRIGHRTQSGTTNYFTFPAGRWTSSVTDNEKHTWSQVVDLSHPENTYYEVKFTGHKIDIYAGKNKMMGIVEYYIDDDETPRAVGDLYNNGNINSTYITTISGLTEGTHTLKAVATNNRNKLGSGDLQIDAAEVYVYTYVNQAASEKPKEPEEPKITVTPDEAMKELKSNKDIRTGSSISSKAEQLAYLVPPEYVGWIDGKCVIGTNPVSEDVYRRFKSGKGSFAGGTIYNEVNLSANISLSNYGASFEKVFVRTTSGNTWVYYYLKFANAAWANRFFEDYFRDNQSKLNEYLKSYITNIRLNPVLEASDSLNMFLAGNMITGSASNYKLVPYTSANLEENSKVYEEFLEYENQFGALNKILRKGYKDMTQTQKNNSVYENVVDVDAMRNLRRDTLYFYEDPEDATSQPIAMIKKMPHDNPEPYHWTGTGNDSELHLIICDGNVSVEANFTGLIIASGTITINKEVTVSADDFLNIAMMAETREIVPFLGDEPDVIQHMPLYFLVEGQEKEIKPEKDITDKTYTAADFVIYENWSKQ